MWYYLIIKLEKHELTDKQVLNRWQEEQTQLNSAVKMAKLMFSDLHTLSQSPYCCNGGVLSVIFRSKTSQVPFAGSEAKCALHSYN